MMVPSNGLLVSFMLVTLKMYMNNGSFSPRASDFQARLNRLYVHLEIKRYGRFTGASIYAKQHPLGCIW